MGLSYNEYRKLKENGQLAWDTDLMKSAWTKISELQNNINGQQLATQAKWDDTGVKDNKRLMQESKGLVQYIQTYANSIKDSSPDQYKSLTEHIGVLNGALGEADNFMKGYDPSKIAGPSVYELSAGRREEQQQAARAQEAVRQVESGGMTAKDAAAKYGFDEKELQTSVWQRKYEGKSAEELISAMTAQNAEVHGQEIYNNLVNKLGVDGVRALLADEKSGKATFKQYGDSYGVSADKVIEVVKNILRYDDHHYESHAGGEAMSDDERAFLYNAILEKGSAKELQELQKNMPDDSFKKKVMTGAGLQNLKQKAEEKSEQEYYLQILEKYPDAKEAVKAAKSYGVTADRVQKEQSAQTQDNGQGEPIDLPQVGKRGEPGAIDPKDKRKTALKTFYQMVKDGVDVDRFEKYGTRYEEHEKAVAHQERLKTLTQQNVAMAGLMNVLSVPENMIGSLFDGFKYLGAVGDQMTGGEGYIDPRTTHNYNAQAIRGATDEMIDNPVGKFFYNTSTSMADSAFAMAVSAIPVVGQAASAAMFSSSAGVSAANEVMENGGTLAQAVSTGFVFGAVEALTEEFSIEKLEALTTQKNVTGVKVYFKNILKQSVTEGSEEVAATLADTLADAAINGDNSELKRNVQRYVDSGMSKDEAEKKAMAEWLIGGLTDFAGGAVSGAVFGAGGSAVNYMRGKGKTNVNNMQVTKAQLADMAELAGESNSEAMKTATEIVQKQGVEKVLSAAKLSDNEKTRATAAHFEELNVQGKLEEADAAQLLVNLSKEQVTSNKMDEIAKALGEETKSDYVEKRTMAEEYNRSFDLSGQKRVESTSSNVSSFGEQHPNGVAAKDNSGKDIVVLGIDSSVAEFGTNDKTVSLVLENGTTVDAGSVAFADGDFQRLVNLAPNYDTLGARALLSGWESAKANGMSVDSYTEEFAKLYEMGRRGMTVESAKQSPAYQATVKELGDSGFTAAIAAGLNDRQLSRQTRSYFQKKVRVKGKSFAQSRVRVDLDVHIEMPDEVRQALDYLAEKTGKEIVITNALEAEDKGAYSKNSIYLNAQHLDAAAMTTALHEAVHNMRAYSEEDYRVLEAFITNYLTERGVNMQQELDSLAAVYGEDAPTNDDLMEELVCKTVEALASDEKALQTALDCKKNRGLREKVGEIFKKIADFVKSYFKGDKEKGLLPHNEWAQAFLDSAEKLQEMAEIVSRGFDAARENEAKYGSRESGVRFSKKKHHYAKVGGGFSEALQAEEWAKYTNSMTTGLDAGLRVSKDSMLVSCENGDYKYVIYDNETENKDIIVIYKIEGVNYNNTSAKQIAVDIKDMEDRGYDQQKILDRLLNNHAQSHGYVLSRYSRSSKRFINVGQRNINVKKNNQRQSNGAGVSGQAQGGISGAQGNKQLSGKKSKDDTIYLSAVERGDMETAQRMVDEAAMQWSAYSVDGKIPLKVYHGTLNGGFNEFGGRHDYWYFSNSKEYSNVFAGYGENGEPSRLLKDDTKGFYNPKIYEAYLKIQKPFITDDIDIIEDAFYWDRTLPEAMRSQGYDALMLKDLSQIIILYPENIKSADPVTYDDDGNIIPLSQRFNKKNNDIRYSKDDTIYDVYDDGDFGFGEEIGDDGSYRRGDFDKLLEESPEEAAYVATNATMRTLERSLKNLGSVKLEQADYEKIARRMMREFGIKERLNNGIGAEIADDIEAFVQNVKSYRSADFSTLIEGLTTVCKRYLEQSGDMVRNPLQEQLKDFFKGYRGATLLVSPYEESEVLDGYDGDWRKLRRELAGFFHVGSETEQKRTGRYKRGIKITDLIADLSSETGHTFLPAGIDTDNFEMWKLLPQLIDFSRGTFVNRFESGEGQSMASAAVEMAMDIAADVVKAKTDRALTSGKSDRKEIVKLTRDQKALVAEQRALRKARERKAEKRLEKMRQRYRKEAGLRSTAEEELSMYKLMASDDMRSYRREYQERQRKNNAIRQLGRKLSSLTKRLDGKANKNAYIPESLKQPILDVLSLFQVENKDGNVPAYFGAFRELNAVKSRVDALSVAYGKLKGKTDFGKDALGFDINALAYDEGVLRELQELSELVKDKRVFELDSFELGRILEVMNDLDRQLKGAVEIIVDGKKTTIAEATSKGISELDSVHYKKDSKALIMNWLKEARNRFVATSLDPVRYGRFLSGYRDDAVWNKLMGDLHHGDQERVRIMQQAYMAVQAVTAQYNRKELEAFQRKAVDEFTMKDRKTGEDVKLSQGLLLSIYLTDQQADGHRHLCAEKYGQYTKIADLDTLNGNRVLPDVSGKQQKAKGEYAHEVVLDKETLRRIGEYVERTPLLRDLARAIHGVLNGTLSDEINKVSMQRYGKMIATVKNYFPLQIDHDDPNKQFETSFEGENIFTDQRMKSRGFTKQRTTSWTAVVIDDALNVFQRHVNETAEYCGLLIPVENIKKVINSNNGEITMRKEIEQKFGGSAIRYLNKLIGEIQERKDTLDENLLTKTTGHMMGAALAFNPRSWLKNYGVLPLANKYFGAKNVTKAVAVTKAGWGKTGRDLVEKYNDFTPYMWYREQGNGTVVGELSRQHGIYGRATEAVDFMSKFDRAVVNLLLYAAEQNVKQTTDLAFDSEEFKKEVAKRFEKCVDETQPNSMLTSKPQFVRSKVMRVLSLNAFASQRMAMGNGLMDSWMEFQARRYEYQLDKNSEEAKTARNKALKGFVSSFFGVLESAALQGLLSILASIFIFHRWDELKDEEGKVTLKGGLLGGLKMWGKGIPEEFFGSFAWTDKVYSVIEKKLDKNAYGADFNVMSLSAVTDIYESINKGKWDRAFGKFMDTINLPMLGGTNMQKLIRSGYSYFQDIKNGQLGFMTNQGKPDYTYMGAYINSWYDSGDTAKAEKWTEKWVQQHMQQYHTSRETAEDFVNKKLAAGLARTDEAVGAAIARADGNATEAEKQKNALNRKGYSEAVVDLAAAQAMKDVYAYLDDEKPKDREEAEGLLMDYGFSESGAAVAAQNWLTEKTAVKKEYTAKDAFVALQNGDTESVEVIRKELDNGKSAEEFLKSLRSLTYTKPLFEELEEATDKNDRARLNKVIAQLVNVYGSAEAYKAKYKEYTKKKSG